VKGYHALLIGGALSVGAYLLYKNWQMFLGGVANQNMGGYNFGVLNPDSWNC
jgi:hypothetical protein